MADAGQVKAGLERIGDGGPVGALERVTAMAGNLRARVMAMPSGQRRWLVASALLIAAVCAGMMWYAGRTDWRVLFSGLDGKDAQQIAQELAAAGIPYQLTEDGGGIQVGSDQVDKARMEVATKGMPQSGRMGFELFDKPNWVGSEFDEKVNYQRALEGELEHTIGTLSAVRSARVHIVLPKESMFAAEERVAKASVVLKLRRSAMPPEQVESIRSLVAGAVENLSPEQVTLVDADGRVNLNAPGKDGVGGDAEHGLEEKLIAMLEPTAGQDNVHATVNVSYDDSSQEKTDEIYDPTLVAALTMQKSTQTSGQPAKAGGVPGTASNTPGAAAAGSAQAAAQGTAAAAAAAAAASKTAPAAVPPLMQVAGAAKQPDAGLPVYPQSGMGEGQTQTITEENGSYAVTRHLLHSEQGPGRVRRVTAAVVVNDRMQSEGLGKAMHTVWKPRSPEEMHRLEQLAQAAVGFDAARGDQLVIENVGFSSNVPEVAPPAMERLADQTGALLHAQPELLKTLSVCGLSALLVLVVLRPMAKQMMVTLSQPVPPLALRGGADGLPGVAGSASGRLSGATAEMFAGGGRPSEAQAIYEHVSAYIRKEPGQSTRMLQSWIGAPKGKS